MKNSRESKNAEDFTKPDGDFKFSPLDSQARLR